MLGFPAVTEADRASPFSAGTQSCCFIEQSEPAIKLKPDNFAQSCDSHYKRDEVCVHDPSSQ